MNISKPGTRNPEPGTRTNTQLAAGQFFGSVAERRTCSDCLLTELHHSCEKQFPHHTHAAAYFCLLLDGRYAEEFGGRNLEYKPMSLVLHPENFTHRDEVGRQGARFFMIEVAPPRLKLLADYGGLPPVLQDLRGNQAVWPALRLYREFRQGARFAELAMEGLLLELLALSARTQVIGEKQAPAWLSQVRDLLHDEFEQSLTVNGIAQRVGVHPFHLAKVFRQFYGRPVGDYLHDLRINHALEYLAAPAASIAEVAYKVGFADQSHFTRIFRQVVGMTPGAYRATLGLK